LLSVVRAFFDSRGYFEVDTPLLSHDRTIDRHLAPFEARIAAGELPHTAASAPCYLQASPEFAMKRLLAAGADSIYQVAHVFRGGERGRLHNPEFTMVEWYKSATTHIDQMNVVEALVTEAVRAVASQAGWCATRAAVPERPFKRTIWREAFVRHAGCDVWGLDTAELRQHAFERCGALPAGMGEDRDDWLNLLLVELVEPNLGARGPEFLHDYPPSQGALARIRPGPPAVAERFELYWRGIELCNGYHELTDAIELRERISVESARRERAGLPPLPDQSRLLECLEAGLPPCAGVALGFDRLLMLACGAGSIDEVIPFAIERA
jgi:lysyl-tRNA synthetase class 2